MADDPSEPEWLKFGVAAALSRQYAADARQLLPLLAQMLEQALPGEASVDKRGSLFGPKHIWRLTLPLGENRYTIEDPGRGPLVATRTRVVRGIALKTEALSVEQWLGDLGAALDERARTSAQAREALARMVG